jgi:cytochrome c
MVACKSLTLLTYINRKAKIPGLMGAYLQESNMTRALWFIAAASLLAAGSAAAQSGADVAKAKGCLNCHDAAAKKVGPSFKDLAAKHAADKGAAATARLKEGKGHVKFAGSEAELKSVIDFVLATK